MANAPIHSFIAHSPGFTLIVVLTLVSELLALEILGIQRLAVIGPFVLAPIVHEHELPHEFFEPR